MSIFKGTIRKHEWKTPYSNHILARQLELAPAGTLKVHTFEAGVSDEPTPVSLAIEPHEAMLKAIRIFGGEWGIPCGIPLTSL